MALSEKQKRHLRGLAHPLEPLVRIGQGGLSDGVIAETVRTLHDHELIKVRVQAGDREARERLLAELAARTGSELVQRIGHVAVLYRRRDDLPRIVLPD